MRKAKHDRRSPASNRTEHGPRLQGPSGRLPIGSVKPRPGQKRRKQARLRLEQLEARQMLDSIPVQVSSLVPSGYTNADVSDLALLLSKPVVGADARLSTSYELRSLGTDKTAGTADDQVLTVSPSYADTSTRIDLVNTSSVAVDLRTWAEVDYSGGAAGTWNVATGGASVTQTYNGSTTFFVGPDSVIDRQFLGRLRMANDADDDFVGLVFGLQTNASSKPNNFYVLTWKKGNQNDTWGYAEAGYKLLKVTSVGALAEATVNSLIWNGENGSNVQVLARNDGTNTLGWSYNTDYAFFVNYQSIGQVYVSIRQVSDNALKWEASVTDASPLGSGKLGFFNLSQSQVTYSGLSQSAVLPEGAYRLTAYSGNPGLRTTEGIALDGNGDGTGGDNYVGALTIDKTAPAVSGTPSIQSNAIAVNYYDWGGVNTTTATSTANYTLNTSGGDGIFDNGNDVTVAISNGTYQAGGSVGAGTATLGFTTSLPDEIYRLTINGTSGVKDLAGNNLSGGTQTFTLPLLTSAATASIALSAASDSGSSSTDGITKITTPTFNVTVNKAGVIAIDYNGDGTPDASQTVASSGTYSFTPSSAMANGSYTASASFTPASGNAVQATTPIVIDTAGPMLSGTGGTAQAPFYQRTLTFNEAVQSLALGNLTFTGPGSVSLAASLLSVSGSGSSYTVAFSPQTGAGSYSLAVAAGILDLAGNASSAAIDSLTVTADTTSPTVSSITPSGSVGSNVSSIQVKFGEFINTSSFTASDVVVTLPDGSTVPTAQITVTPVATGRSDLINTFNVTLSSALATEGTYTVAVGPAISDLSGNQMTTLVQVDDQSFASLPTDWDFYGNAAWNAGGFARLTPASSWMNGAAYFGTSQTPAPFLVNFDFTLTSGGGSGNGADGLCFVVAQNAVLGGSGVGIGYSGALGKSFAVEFDTYYNGGTDPDNNHIALDWNGSFQSTAVSVGPGPWMVGTGTHHATIRFDGVSRVTATLSSPTGKVTTLTGDVPAAYLPTQYTFGFVSATGAGWANHDIDNVQVYLMPGGGQNGVVSSSFTIDKTGPSITSMSPSASPAVTSAVSYADVTFNEAIAASSFSAADVTLLAPDGSTIAASEPTYLSGNTYRIAFPTQQTNGTYTLTVGPDVTDAAGNRMDTHAAGAYSGQFTIAMPNLQVTGITLPVESGIVSGQSIDFAFTVTNNGGAMETYTGWYDRAVLSTDAIYGNDDDVPLAPYYGGDIFFQWNSLGAGESYTVSQAVTLPHGISGTYHILVCTDLYNSVTEDAPGETDNTAISLTGGADNGGTIHIALAAYPDITVDDLAVDPSSVLTCGGTVTITWNDANHGDGATYASWMDHILVMNTTNGQMLVYSNSYYSGVLAAGESVARSSTFMLPEGDWAAGELEITVITDEYNALYEYNDSGHDDAEGNNTSTIHATSTLPPTPDLEVADVAVSPSPQSSGTVTITWNDVNHGTGPTTTSWYDRVLVVNTTTGSTLLDTTVPCSTAVAAAGSVARSRSLTLPDGDAGVGTLRVTITTDYTDTLYEYKPGVSHEAGEGNNTGTPLDVASSLGLYADLEVADVAVSPASPQSGNTVTISWNDVNHGTGATAGTWYDRVLVVNTTTGSTLLNTTVSCSTAVAAAGSVARSRSFTLPDGNAGVGSLQVTITTDYTGTLYEYKPGASHAAGEGNNTGTLDVASTLAPYADLQVTGVQLVQASPKSGDTVSVRWTEQNAGNLAVGRDGYTWVRVTKSGAATPFYSQVLYYNAAANAGLTASGGSVTRQVSVALPQGADGAGTFNISVTADYYNQLLEYNAPGTAETNNTGSGSFVSTIADYPDLTVTDLAVSTAAPTAGQPMTVTWSLANAGTAALTQSFYHWLQVRGAGGSQIASVVLYYDAAAHGPIAAGASSAQSYTLTLPDGASGAGDLTVRVRADYYSQVYEYNPGGTAETNNESQITVHSELAPYAGIQVGDVRVTTGDDDLRPGAQIAVEWTITNNGSTDLSGPFSERILLSGDGAVGGDTLLTTLTFPATTTLAAGASVSRLAAVTLPTFTSGAQWLVVQGDAGQQVYELDESDNSAIADEAIDIPLGLTMSIDHSALTEGGSAGAITVSRNGATDGALVVSMSNTQSAALVVPATVTIPAHASSVTFAATPADNDVVGGSLTAAVSAAAAGFQGASLSVSVAEDDVPTLSVQLSPDPVSEGSGSDAVRVRVLRNTDTTLSLQTVLACNDALRLDVPLLATIPAGADYVDVYADVRDNSYIDGLKQIAVTASATGFVTGGDSLAYLDNDIPNLSLAADAMTVSEGAGGNATTVTVTRSTASPIDVYVQITGGSGSLTTPALVRIPAFQASASFSVGTINDSDVTGDRSVILTARVTDSFTHVPQESGKATVTVRVTEDDGPALTVTALDPAIREDATGTLRIRRNSGTTGALPVTLLSSDTTEATVAGSVTIPDGSDHVDVVVSGVQDAAVDGAQSVTFTGAAAGFGGGAAVMSVTDGDLADLAVTGISAPASGETGGTVTVSYTVANQGIASATGSWTDKVYVCDQPTINSSATLVRQFVRTSPLAVGGEYTNSVTMSLPSVVGTHYLLVQTDVVGALDELREGNNSRSSSAIRVAAAYTATVFAGEEVYGSGEAVLLRGVATRTADGSPAAFEFVKLYVRVSGTTRTLTAFTAGDGTYQATFQPLSSEAGNYEVGATHPGLSTFTAQDTFAIAGMRASGTSVSLTPDVPVARTITITNRSSVAISGIACELLNLPSAGITLDVTVPDALPGGGTASLAFTVNATDPDLGHGTVTIRLTSAEGATLDIPVEVDVVPLTALLVTTPGSLSDGVVRGQRKTLGFTLSNTGSAPSGAITVTLPEYPWMRLVSPATIASLAPGGTAGVTLELNPAEDQPLVQYSGQIAINSANGASRAVGFAFRMLSEAKGDVAITVVDDYTYYVEGAPKVAGATVRLYDPITGEKLYEATADSSGVASFTDVAEGSYQLDVYAPKHSTYRARLDVKPGVTNESQVFLARQLVTYSWTVVPVEIEDTYKIVLEPVFETNVPVPVVTIDNPNVMPLVVEDEWTQFDITMTNHGLIAAQGLTINLPSSPYYDFEVLASDIGVIPAKTTVSVPVRIRGKPSVFAQQQSLAAIEQALREGNTAEAARLRAQCLEIETGIPCLNIEITALYYYICGEDRVYHQESQSIEPVCVAKDIYDCIKQALESIEESLPTLGGNLLSAPCAVIDVILQCADTDLGDCQKAMIKAACRGVVGGIEGGWVGALAGAAGELLDCVCDLLDWDFAPGSTTNTTSPWGPGEPGYGVVPIGTPSTGTTYTTEGCTPGDVIGPIPGGLAIPSASGEGVCARVRLQIEQRAVLTRTGFAGLFELENGTEGTDLNDISVTIDIRDADGNSANDKFGFRDPDVTGMGNVSGSGVLVGGQTGSARWLFVPTRDAAPENPTAYRIGGTLRYTENGVEVEVPLLPATITVFPDPLLSLDYFLQRDVYSDDPFTDEVEPSEPFTLGVLVSNTGAGNAHHFAITSGQPKIIENEKGLLIDFEIIGTQVGDDEVSPSMTVEFGNIDAGTSSSARWLMTSTLQGHFVEFDATFEHVDDFGNSRTSLIDEVNFHDLNHALRVDLPDQGWADDLMLDFLANDLPDPDNLPDMVYFSGGGSSLVHAVTTATVDGSISPGHLTRHVTASGVDNGWTYVVVDDPGADYTLQEVIRSDGTPLAIDDHVWRTDRTFGAEGRATYVDELHILDLVDGDGDVSYTLVYGKPDATAPTIVAVGPVTPDPRNDAVASIEVTFSEALADGSFDVSDLALTRGDTVISLDGTASIVRVDATTYRIEGLTVLTAAAGEYTLTIDAAGIEDPWANAGSGSTSESWLTVPDSPVITSLGAELASLPLKPDAPARVTNQAVTGISVVFSMAIDPDSFDLADVTLTLDGEAVELGEPATIEQVSATEFTIRTPAGFTGDDGEYTLTVDAAGVTGDSDNAGVGTVSVTWTMDTVAPTIVSLEELATNPRNIAVLSLDVEFSEPIDVDTLDAGDITLVRNGGEDVFTTGLTFTQITSTKLQLSGFTSLTGYAGTYTFTVVGAGITDPAGNAVTGSDSTEWVLDLTAPAAPTDLAIVPDNGSSDEDGRTNTLNMSLTGGLLETNLTVRVYDTTTGDSLGAVQSGEHAAFSKSLRFTDPGVHRLKVYAVDQAGNVSEYVYFDLFIDLTHPEIDTVTGLGSTTVSVPADELTITFTEAIDPTTFTAADVTLTLDGEPVGLPAILISADPDDPTVYRIGGLSEATGELGDYVLTVDLTGIADETGNTGAEPYEISWSKVPPTATIGDYVWYDTNYDGVQDATEAGAAGVIVMLYQAGAASPLAVTTTDDSGEYAFSGLDAALRYFVEFAAPDGYGLTQANVVSDVADSDAEITTGRTSAFDVAVGDNATWDAGLVPLGSIGGAVFNDSDGDGVRGDSESALSGWTVFLDVDGDLVRDAAEPSAETDSEGAYLFEDLRPGTYSVVLELAAGWRQTTPDASGVTLQTLELGVQTNDVSSQSSPGPDAGDYAAALDLINVDLLRADPRFAGLTGAGYSVVIIDTGIDSDNPFFGPDSDHDGVADRIIYQYDFAGGDGDASDATGHGTHVAGIIGSSDATYAGVAPGASLIVLKVFDDGGTGVFTQVERALQWVTTNVALYNIVAVNLSFGDGRNWNWPAATDCGCGGTVKRQTYGMGDELATLRAMNVLVTAAAGNSFFESNGVQGLNYPAADPATISVGAVWAEDGGGPWDYQGTGAVDYTSGADRIAAFSQRQAGWLDVFAPGVLIPGAADGGGVTTMHGTSQATAFVTGAAVLADQLAMQHLHRRLTLTEFRTLLQTSGATILDGDDENDNVINSGQAYVRLDVYALANAILALDPTQPADDSGDEGNGGSGGGSVTPLSPASHAYEVILAPGGRVLTAHFGVQALDVTAPFVESTTVHRVAGDSSGVDSLSVQFSEATNLPDLITAGTITSAVTLYQVHDGQASQAVASAAGQFAWDAGSHTLTWTLASALPPGRFELHLDPARIADASGNHLLGSSGGVPGLAAAVNVEAGGADVQAAAYSVPSLADFDGDGVQDLIVGERVGEAAPYSGKVRVYHNAGTDAAPVYAAATYVQLDGADLTVSATGCLGAFPRVVDWNGDGHQDLLVGLADGTLLFFRNTSAGSDVTLAAGVLLQAGPAGAPSDIDVGDRAAFDLADWNNDGSVDLVVGSLDGTVRVYLNQAASGTPDLAAAIVVQAGAGDLAVATGRSSPAVYDLNGDGRKDLVVGNTEGQLLVYLNQGTDAAPAFDDSQSLSSVGVAVDLAGSARSRPYVADFNDDGIPDVLVGAADGLVRLYLGQRPTSTFTVVPTAPSGLAILPDRGTSTSDGLTNTGSVTLSGTLAEADLSVALYDVTTAIDLGSATVVGTSFSAELTLAEGTHRIRVRAIDADGDASADSFFDVVVDLTAPHASIDRLTTNDTRPRLSGTVNDADAVIQVTVNGRTYTVVNAGASWTLADNAIAVALTDGTYDVSVAATDPAGNVGYDATADELVIDTVAPLVGVTSRVTNDTTPSLTGPVNDASATIRVAVNGRQYDAVNLGATWSLADNTLAAALAEGAYDVTVYAYDPAGNTGTDGTVAELRIDLTPPTVTVNPLATPDTTPQLSGRVNDTAASIRVSVNGSNYVATNNRNGTWTLADNTIGTLAVGTYSVTATATDLAGNVGSEATANELSITAIPNAVPVGVADAYVGNEDTALVVPVASGVLANDSDANGDPLTAVLLASPGHGTLSLAANGSFLYTPSVHWHGTDSFQYRAYDAKDYSDPVTVTITVAHLNHLPVVVDRSYVTTQGETLSVAAPGLLGGVSDIDSDALSASAVAGPSHGVLAVSANGAFTYTPAAGWYGADSFTYRAYDGTGYSNVATVALTVNQAELPAPAVVQSAVVNGGGKQRSMVTSVVVTFSTEVTFSDLAGAFGVARRGGGGAVVVAAATSVVGGKTVATLTFSGAGTQYGSLADGSYLLTILADKVANFDGDRNGVAGGNYQFGAQKADQFYRWFGDSDGDWDTDGLDYTVFSGTYGKATGNAKYVAHLDFNADGKVDSADLAQFVAHNGKKLTFIP